MRAPVVLFVYKRKDKTEKCIQALECNRLGEETDLLIFSDGFRGQDDKEQVLEVRKFINDYQKKSKFRKVYIFESESNKGLSQSVIYGVTYAMEHYGKCIVVEDDLITSADFLEYMNGALDFYENDMRYGSISAYTYPLKELREYDKDMYVLRKGECWGWATWKNRWDDVDWEIKNYNELISDKDFRKEFSALQYGLDNMLVEWKEGRVDSWAVRWCLHLFLKKQLTVYPTESRANNIGFDGTGANCGADYVCNVSKIGSEHVCSYEFLDVNSMLEKKVAIFERGNVIQRIKRVFWKIWKKMIQDVWRRKV